MNKFMLMIFFLFLLVLGYAYVCNDDTRVMKEKIGILKQNKISLPLERMKYICHRSMGENTQINKSLKFVSYSDSMACSSCAVDKLYTWIDLIRKTESYENKLGYYFILNSATHIVRNKFKILSNNILPSILPCQKIHLT